MKYIVTKINSRIIIILIILFLLILGGYWLIQINTRREGLTDAEKAETKKFSDDLLSTIKTKINSAGVNINGGKSFDEIQKSIPGVFDSLKDIFTKESSLYDDVSFNSNRTNTVDTTPVITKDYSQAYGKNFMDDFFSGKNFAYSLTAKYKKINDVNADVSLNNQCNRLTSESCNQTDSCVWVGSSKGTKCMAASIDPNTGLVDGPLFKQDRVTKQDIDYSYYTYKNECYGKCGAGANYANPCSEFSETDININDKCLKRLWKQSGCTNQTFFTDPSNSSKIVNEFKKYTKAEIAATFKDYNTEKNFTQCYGPNENIWPSCSTLYPNSDSTNLSKRCLKQMYNDAGCNQTADIITNDFTDANKLMSKGEIINLFKGYRDGLDDDGNLDADYAKCFGTTNWPLPCADTTDNSIGLSKRCLTSLFYEKGCTDPSASIITQTYVGENKDKRKLEMLNFFQDLKYKVDDTSFTQCYGANRSVWPARTMLLGIGTDNNIYLKRGGGIEPVTNQPRDIINAIWERDDTAGQIGMRCITQLTNTSKSLLGIGNDFRLYKKEKLSDIWVRYPNDNGVYITVRQLDDGNVVGIGRNARINLYDSASDRFVYKPPTGNVTDILYSPHTINSNAANYLLIGSSRGLWSRPNIDNGTGQVNLSSDINNVSIISIVNLPAAPAPATATGARIIGVGANNKLYVRNSALEQWYLLSTNNDIKIKSISYINY
jgi:hypothetical protein